MKSKIKNVLILLIIAVTFASCDNCPEGEPENLIALEQAIEMKNLFLEMDGNPSNSDDTDVTFSLEDVQKYLHKMAVLGKEQGNEELGLRVHFARKTVDGTAKRTVFFETVAPVGDAEGINPLLLSKWKTVPNSAYYNMGDGGNNEVPTDTTDTPDPRKPKDPK